MNKNKLFFCTIFDSSYLAKGVAMISSLNNVCKSFHIYIFAFDNQAVSVLNKLELDNSTIISLEEFETDELIKIKKDRNTGEYCWTCKGPAIKYCFEKYALNYCTYIDSDLYFFNSPQILIDEIGENEVLLTEHRFSKEYDLSETNGRYCAQWMTFKNSKKGNEILEWWTGLCLNWCYARIENGRFGDQKYLEQFSVKYRGVVDLNHPGGGLGPWNIQQYKIYVNEKSIKGIFLNSSENFDVIFYHFHFVKHIKINFLNEFILGPYLLDRSVIKHIYIPYLKQLKLVEKKIKKIDYTIDSLGSMSYKRSALMMLGHIFKSLTKKNKIMWI